MNQEALNSYARAVSQRLLVKQAGDMDFPETWITVAHGLKCHVASYYCPGGEHGDYTSCGDGEGLVRYNTAITPPAQARVIVHELSHHLLMPLIAGYLFGDYVRCSYHDDPADVRHRIAQRVEQICFRRP